MTKSPRRLVTSTVEWGVWLKLHVMEKEETSALRLEWIKELMQTTRVLLRRRQDETVEDYHRRLHEDMVQNGDQQ